LQKRGLTGCKNSDTAIIPNYYSVEAGFDPRYDHFGAFLPFGKEGVVRTIDTKYTTETVL